MKAPTQARIARVLRYFDGLVELHPDADPQADPDIAEVRAWLTWIVTLSSGE